MRRTHINQWLLEGEGPRLDFKLSVAAPYKIARNLVAFANAKGGDLIIGVNDAKQIIGTDIEEQQYALEVAGLRFCTPPIVPQFEVYVTQGKSLLIATIAESTQKPHYAIDKVGQQKMFVRIADQCLEPSPLLEEAIWNGDLTCLPYNYQHYKSLKDELTLYLQQNHTISVEQYRQMKQCPERLARRTLFDLLLDGFLRPTDDEQVFKLAKNILR
jgi:hypothetical protein